MIETRQTSEYARTQAELQKDKFQKWGFILFIVGTMLIVGSLTISHELFKAAISGIGGALIGSSASMIFDAKSKANTLLVVDDGVQQIKSEIRTAIQSTSEIYARFGLSEIIAPANGYRYDVILSEAKNLTLIFNDMYRWLQNHNHLNILRDRIRQNAHTTILLLHPESRIIDFVAEISGKSEKADDGNSRQVHDIYSAVRKLTEGIDLGNNIKILGHYRFNTYSAVISDDDAHVVFYPISKRYNNGVIYRFIKGSSSDNEFCAVESDAAELVRLCEFDRSAELKTRTNLQKSH